MEIKTLRYNGPGLKGLRNRKSPYGGVHAGQWPFAMDTDITRLWFQHPDDHQWHELVWEHASELGQPLSAEVRDYARGLARATHRFPDTKRALVELLDRWGAGLTSNPTERRTAVRLSAEQRAAIDSRVGPRWCPKSSATRTRASHSARPPTCCRAPTKEPAPPSTPA